MLVLEVWSVMMCMRMSRPTRENIRMVEILLRSGILMMMVRCGLRMSVRVACIPILLCGIRCSCCSRRCSRNSMLLYLLRGCMLLNLLWEPLLWWVLLLLTVNDVIVIWNHTNTREIGHCDDFLGTVKSFCNKTKTLESLIKSLFRPSNLLFFLRNSEEL